MFVACTIIINIQNIQETKLIDRFRLIEQVHLVLPRLGSRDRSASTMACLPLRSQKFLADVYVLWHVYKNLTFIFPQVTFVVPIICGEL
jgi:hypothetical protein